MGKRILSLCLALLCIVLTGCAPVTPAETEGFTSEPTTTQPFVTLQTEATDPTQETVTETQAPTEETTAPTEDTTPPTEPVIYVGTPGTEWTPICNEYINLWAAPHSNTVICQIPVGSTVYLEKWQEKFAQVIYDGKLGYVHANYIKPQDTAYFTDKLKAVTPTYVYSYEQMLSDMDELQMLYPDLVSISKIGSSELGRKIPALIIGNPDAEYHVLIQGAMHAREHFTAWIAMAIADYALLQNRLNTDICYHIIPMSNPDGVVISQSGQLNETQAAIYQQDLSAGYTSSGKAYYAEQWKANALGVDLNRNFSAGWEDSLERPNPSSEKYRGEEAFSAAESKALRDYTLQYDFDATVSIHSHGSVIYYQYGKKQPVNQLSYSFAKAVQNLTGYVPTSFDNTTGAGYKDWAMEELGIPSLTLEIGNTSTPMAQRDIYNTFHRCRDLLPTIYQWLKSV